MDKNRHKILITNDDGYAAKGLQKLVGLMRTLGDVVLISTDEVMSAKSHSCTIRERIYVRLVHEEEGFKEYRCNGTPVDCVKMALAEICPRRPDMVIGGINHGDNASVNAHYSGTMGVTLEGCMKYIPSVAFSLCDHRDDADFEPLRPLIRQITERVLKEGLPLGVCLNVNFPLVDAYHGVRVCRMAKGTWGNEVTKCHHPRGYDYWWMVGSYTNDEPEAEDTDNWALSHGYVAITPTQIDVTAYSAMELISDWFKP